ncbi:unnamed protein product, partial [Pylaiella littoralis]
LSASQVPPPGASSPTGLRDEVSSLDDAKTNNLPSLACLAIGAPVVLHKSPQFVVLGVCNNADGVVCGIELGDREETLQNQEHGHRVVHLKYPPVKVQVYIKAADNAGLQLPGLPRGVINVSSVEQNQRSTSKLRMTLVCNFQGFPAASSTFLP